LPEERKVEYRGYPLPRTSEEVKLRSPSEDKSRQQSCQTQENERREGVADRRREGVA